jgi:CRP-like cAMP-binding protein
MNNEIEQIRQVISSYIDFNQEEWEEYASMFRVRKVAKKEVLLNEGTVCRDVFFVCSGLLRIYFIDHQGEEKTFHFSLENTFATDYESLLKVVPAHYSIQAMEDTTVVLMSLEMLQSGYQILQNGEKLGRLLAETYFFLLSDKIRAIYTQSPLERYNNMNTAYPGIVQRIPQHYLASYLNISSVHLSRLKHSEKENQ